MIYFTSDTHFGSKEILKRENRPFKNKKHYAQEQIKIWNKKARTGDIIYHLGDFANYNSKEHKWKEGLKAVKHVRADVILVIGNNEERIIKNIFHDSFEDFREYCMDLGFKDIVKNAYLKIEDREFYLNHYPKNHKPGYINLFGHNHRGTGLYKPFGLNVGCDLNYFRLYSEYDIFDLIETKERWWDGDENINCI